MKSLTLGEFAPNNTHDTAQQTKNRPRDKGRGLKVLREQREEEEEEEIRSSGKGLVSSRKRLVITRIVPIALAGLKR